MIERREHYRQALAKTELTRAISLAGREERYAASDYAFRVISRLRGAIARG